MHVSRNDQTLPGLELKSLTSSNFIRFLSVDQVLSWFHLRLSQTVSFKSFHRNVMKYELCVNETKFLEYLETKYLEFFLE